MSGMVPVRQGKDGSGALDDGASRWRFASTVDARVGVALAGIWRNSQHAALAFISS